MTHPPRALLTAMFDAAVAAADPMLCVPAHLPRDVPGRLIVVGAGKASARMAQAVEAHRAGPLEGVVVTRYGHGAPCERIRIVEAAHPVPDAAGESATRDILKAVSGLTAQDTVLALISGGGSALLTAPADGITLEEKRAVNAALLRSGAHIGEMNTVRKHLSRVKGGGLAGAAYPARVLVGPPLRGAAVALRNTINGNKLAGPLIPTYPTTMLATHPSSFELMPRAEAQAMLGEDGAPVAQGGLDPALWQSRGWGLANPREAEFRRWLAGAGDDPDARGVARQADLIARGLAFHRLSDRPIDPPEGLDIRVIAGTGEGTLGAVRIVGDHAVEETGQVDGDGTVPLYSAVAGFEDSDSHPRKSLSVVETEHARMVSDPVVFTQILEAIAGD